MRFFRLFFWIACLLHLGLAAWLCLTPELARQQLQDVKLPLIYLQTEGLLSLIQACAFAYVAERPAKSIPVVALAALVNVCLPLFGLNAYLHGEILGPQASLQMGMAAFMLPFLAAYFAWFYHTPRPDRFMPLLGIFGERRR